MAIGMDHHLMTFTALEAVGAKISRHVISAQGGVDKVQYAGK
jgi:hypothetical protein